MDADDREKLFARIGHYREWFKGGVATKSLYACLLGDAEKLVEMVTADEPILLTVAPPANRRTRARVLWERANLRGCCDKYADRKACDCLATAQPDCPICYDPRCQEPGGKH